MDSIAMKYIVVELLSLVARLLSQTVWSMIKYTSAVHSLNLINLMLAMV
jgi:hypothetical protein